MRSRLLCLVLSCLSLAVNAETLSQLTSPLPQSYVSDHAGLLADDTQVELNRLAATLDQAGRGQLAIAVIQTTGGADPRRFATDLFNRWGVGDRDRNDGSLILLARGDRAAEIVLGTGIDTAAARAQLQSVMTGTMVPLFRQGNYDLGLVRGATQVLQQIYQLDLSRPSEAPPADLRTSTQSTDTAALTGLDSSKAPSPMPPSSTTGPRPIPAEPKTAWGWMAAGAGLIMAALSALGWLIYRFVRMLWWFTGSRWFTRRCTHCKQAMQLLSEAADDAHLDPAQRTEERLGSVDHRVYECSGCGRIAQFSRRAWLCLYTDCRQCHARALQSRRETLTEATTYATGVAMIHALCLHCQAKHSTRVVIPKVVESSDSSSYSSSSGGSSFGGGSSSGGGASGRW